MSVVQPNFHSFTWHSRLRPQLLWLSRRLYFPSDLISVCQMIFDSSHMFSATFEIRQKDIVQMNTNGCHRHPKSNTLLFWNSQWRPGQTWTIRKALEKKSANVFLICHDSTYRFLLEDEKPSLFLFFRVKPWWCYKHFSNKVWPFLHLY